MIRQRKRGEKNREIDPNEIFLDSSNLPEFDTHQFEGRMERPVAKHSFWLAGMAFFVIVLAFLWRTAELQIVRGGEMRERAEANRLEHKSIFANRGIIHDRNGVRLAWNALPGLLAASSTLSASSTASINAASTEKAFFLRSYFREPGLAHMLGYVNYPAKDRSGVYYQTTIEGKDGAEKKFDEKLAGVNGLKIEEVDALGRLSSESVIDPPLHGEDIYLSIDSGVQAKLYEAIAALAEQVDFKGGSGVIMDVRTGEILALTNYPEYRSEDLAGGKRESIALYNEDPRTPFLNRAVNGLYAPGSIVKPFMALAALNEGIISPGKQILSTGSITLPNPYFPESPSIFKDWKAHGYVDMRRAIAVSSDVYFYTIGGGYGGQQGLGIARIKKYMEMFRFGEKTGINFSGEAAGVIPDPEWKARTFDNAKWLLGDTYNTVIGQYGMQVTPLQAARAIAALATDGVLVTPTILASSTPEDALTGRIDIPAEHFLVVKEGMRLAVEEGTAKGLDIYDAEVAGKTGTAELGYSKNRVNSWTVGFFPYKNPRYAFAIVMEKGPASNLTGATYVMRQVLDYMARERPGYLRGE